MSVKSTLIQYTIYTDKADGRKLTLKQFKERPTDANAIKNDPIHSKKNSTSVFKTSSNFNG